MSNRFHINSVKVTGPGVRDSEVQFQIFRQDIIRLIVILKVKT